MGWHTLKQVPRQGQMLKLHLTISSQLLYGKHYRFFEKGKLIIFFPIRGPPLGYGMIDKPKHIPSLEVLSLFSTGKHDTANQEKEAKHPQKTERCGIQ